MDLHKLAIRQLKRAGMSEDVLPTQLDQWQAFIKSVSNSYAEADQERYLIERSMELSSHELLALNERLENAQHIARLGYWHYDREHNKISWSKELYAMFGFDPSTLPPSFEQFIQMMHEHDRPILNEYFEKALSAGEGFECEVRVRKADDNYDWYYVIGHVTADEKQPEKKVLSGIVMDITKRKQAEAEIADLHQQLLNSARQAGMADVASSILHNVGNILNSANVSIGILQENTLKSANQKLLAAIAMMKDHLSTLGEFLTNDPKGKLIPEYLIAASEVAENEFKHNSQEINNLSTYIHHVKEIISMQQDFSRAAGVVEKVFLPEMMDMALQMCGVTFEKYGIEIVKKYNKQIFATLDRSALLQILVNLLRNAKDALVAMPEQTSKYIILTIDQNPHADTEVIISVEDNGIGIAPENLTKIFSMGFTTKPNGHGFGLHSSAIKAREMGGNLIATGPSIGHGAVFTLNLPLDAKVK